LLHLWGGDSAFETECVNYTLQNEPIYVRLHLAVYPGFEQTWERVLVSLEDITARRKAEEYLRYLGTHDVLTGLYNRAYYQDEIRRLSGGRRYPITILMADVNGLKKINDSLGHEAGDKIIRRAAEVLRAGFRQEDVVARIGGYEFAVIMPQTDAETAEETLTRLETLLRLNNKFYGEPQLSLSVGIATAAPGEDLETVMRRADDEMYRRKREYYRQIG
jgi:diguanylate cyclase (GGDEF)-like protein